MSRPMLNGEGGNCHHTMNGRFTYTSRMKSSATRPFGYIFSLPPHCPQGYSFMPPVLQSLGLFIFRSPPPVCISMAAQLLAVLPMAALCKACMIKVGGGCEWCGKCGGDGGPYPVTSDVKMS